MSWEELSTSCYLATAQDLCDLDLQLSRCPSVSNRNVWCLTNQPLQFEAPSEDPWKPDSNKILVNNLRFDLLKVWLLRQITYLLYVVLKPCETSLAWPCYTTLFTSQSENRTTSQLGFLASIQSKVTDENNILDQFQHSRRSLDFLCYTVQFLLKGHCM